MDGLKDLIRGITALFYIVLQQGFVVGLGYILYAQVELYWAVIVWLLCIPMFWVNKWTWLYVTKYGVINFMTANSDTSEIDVPPGDRWYNN